MSIAKEFREFAASTFPPTVGHHQHLKVDQEGFRRSRLSEFRQLPIND
jgi:hypothetical protein